MKREKRNKNKGITLIALVVTIVVLLILAAITINLVLGDDGVIKKTQDAATEHRAGTVEDEVTIWKSGKQLDQYLGTTSTARDKLIEDQVARKLLTEEEAEKAKEAGWVQIGSKIINYGNDIDNPPKAGPIDTATSYVGYYADLEGDGEVDGIIYADLAVGGEGVWNSGNWNNYQYSAISEGLKEYYINQTGYEGIFGTKDVLSPTGTGKDRFYIMALEDIKDEEQGNLFCWYDAAYDMRKIR